MNYHSIFHDDMKNGTGLRVTLFVSGCAHNCRGCHNPDTHDPKSGEVFDENALNKIKRYLDHDYIDGITITGGDPLYPANLTDVYNLICIIRKEFPNKTIWLYTGYKYEELKDIQLDILNYVDVLVDGPFEFEKRDTTLPFRGSSNQRIIHLDNERTI